MALSYPDFEEHLYRCLRNENGEPLSEILSTKETTLEQRAWLTELEPLAAGQSFNEFVNTLRARRPSLFHFAFDKTDDEATREKYSFLLEGKRVALVGPSAYLVGSGLGKAIESYDLVARLNFQWPIPKALESDLGYRQDLLYHCCNGDRPIKALLSQPSFGRTKFVCYERGFESLILRDYCCAHGIESYCITETFRELTESLQTFANTGTVAIAHLLQFPIRELFVTGITFFREHYYSGYPGDGAHPSHWSSDAPPRRIWEHDFAPQLAYFQMLLQADPRIRIDPRLKEILS